MKTKEIESENIRDSFGEVNWYFSLILPWWKN